MKKESRIRLEDLIDESIKNPIIALLPSLLSVLAH